VLRVPPPAADLARARLLFFVAAVFFGLSALLARIATHVGGMSGGQATLVRFVIGSACMGAFFIARPGALQVRSPTLLAVRAIVGGLSALTYFRAIALIPTGEATLLNNTFPIWGVILSLVFLRERPTWHLVLALGLTSAGVFLVVGGGRLYVSLGRGELLALASGVLGGVAVTVVRALRADHNAATIFFAFALGGLLESAPSVLEPWPASPTPWLAALGVGASALIAQLAMTEAYGALAVAEAAIWQQLTPIASFTWALLLGESVTVATVVGVALGVGGVIYGTTFGRATERPPSARREVAVSPPPVS